MNTRQAKLTACATLLAVAITAGCGKTVQDDFWQPGAKYEVHLHVDERSAQHPEVPAPSADSVRVLVTLDAATKDSLYGRHEDVLGSIGAFTWDDKLEPLRVAVRVWPDSFALTLAYLVSDGELKLMGQVRDSVGSGTWRQLSPETLAGHFEVRRIP